MNNFDSRRKLTKKQIQFFVNDELYSKFKDYLWNHGVTRNTRSLTCKNNFLKEAKTELFEKFMKDIINQKNVKHWRELLK